MSAAGRSVPGMENTTTPTTPSIHVLMRRPLSALRPAPSVSRAAERCATVLRHPRSRIRVSPGWTAPSLRIALPSGPAQVFMSRHRVSTTMWRRLTGAGPDETPPPTPVHLVTLTARAEKSKLTASARNMTTDVHSLFRRTLRSDADETGEGAEDGQGGQLVCGHVLWVSQESCGGPARTDGLMEWTWHALLSGEPGRASAPEPGHGTAA